MSGSRTGGLKAAATNKERHGSDFFKKIGSSGGKVSHPETRPFALNRKLASLAGTRGGLTSRRTGVKNKKVEEL